LEEAAAVEKRIAEVQHQLRAVRFVALAELPGTNVQITKVTLRDISFFKVLGTCF
jgi:hypothetical protein